MLGILVLFYATHHKPLAMRLMRAVNPMSSILPWATQNMRPNPSRSGSTTSSWSSRWQSRAASSVP